MKKLAVILLSLIIASSFAACSSSSDAEAAALLNALQSNVSQVSEKVSDIQEQASESIDEISSAFNGNQAPSQQPTEKATEEVTEAAESESERIQLSGSGKVEDLEISIDYIEGSTIYGTVINHSEKTDYRLGFVNGKIKMKTVDGNVYYITNVNAEVLGEQTLPFDLTFPGYEGKSLPKTITFMSIKKSKDINEKELTINVKS